MKRYTSLIPLFIVSIILLGAFFLMAYKLETHMMFIGDFGWFYLAARDMLLNNSIPLVSMPSSHPWLHQGPFWTYILGIALLLADFHPLIGGYVGILFGLLSVLGIYLLGKELFTMRVGFLAAALYATSPLVIIHSRMPYHTTPIPFFVLCYLFTIIRWVRGDIRYFPFTLLFLGILYNFELATVILAFPFIFLILYGLWKREKYVVNLFSKKIIIRSLLFLIIPLIPVLIYDFSHGFPQTIKFVAWMGYRALRVFGFPSIHPEEYQESNFAIFLNFSLLLHQRLVFLVHSVGAILISLLSIGILINGLRKSGIKKKGFSSEFILSLFFFIPVAVFIANRISSEAYVPMFFPQFMVVIAYTFHELMKIRYLKYGIYLILLGILFLNPFTLIRQNYLMGSRDEGYGATFTQRITVTDVIQTYAKERPFSLKGEGKGSEFESLTMGYEYLLWWKGSTIMKDADLVFIIEEKESDILLRIEDKKRATSSAVLQ